jgi:hypothetical protein
LTEFEIISLVLDVSTDFQVLFCLPEYEAKKFLNRKRKKNDKNDW